MPFLGDIAVPRVNSTIPLAPMQGPACPITFWRGDRAKVVGPEGGTYLYRLIEGHRKGELVWIGQHNAMYGEGDPDGYLALYY